MAKKYKVATEFSIVDRATAALNKMGAAGGVVGGAWAKSMASAQARVDAFGKSVAGAAKLAVGLGVGAVSAGIVAATKQYADFDQAVRAAGAAYGPAFSQAADFEEKITGMGKAVRAVAAATEFDATQSANALKTLALAGVQSEQAVALLPGVADLATAAMTSMEDAVALAVGSLNTMGMMSDVPEVLAGNMTRLSDVMAHTANSAYMSLQDVSAAISQGGSFFRTANNDLNVLSGSLTALAANSIRGAEAGVALRNIMTNLSAPTSSAEKALKKMQIQTKDAAGNMLPLPKIIGQFSKAMAGMGDAERNANLYAIFGKQNIAAVTALLNTGQSALENYASAAANSAGTTAANAEALRGSLVNKFKVLGSALTELGFKFVEAFAVKGGNAIEMLTKAISEFDPTPFVNALVGLVDVVSVVVQAAWAMRNVIMFAAGAVLFYRTAMNVTVVAMKLWKIATTILTGAQLAYGIVIKGSAAATSAYTFASKGAKIATLAFSGVLKIATAAQALFNAVMSMNPIALVVTAIIALIGIILVLTNKWKTVTDAVDGFFKKIHDMKGIGGVILTFLVTPFEMVWKVVRSVFDIFAAFKAGGFINGLKMIGLSVLQLLTSPFLIAFKTIRSIFGAFKAGNFLKEIKAIGSAIQNIFSGLKESWFLSEIREMGIKIVQFLISPFVRIKEAIQNVFSAFKNGGFLEGIKTLGATILDFLVSPFKHIWEIFQTIFSMFKSGSILSGLKKIGLAILEFLVSPLKGILDILSFLPMIGNILDRVSNWFETTRASLLAGGTTESEEEEDSAKSEAATAVPTRTAAAATSYSREENLTTNRVEIGLDEGLSVKSGAVEAPAFTLYTGRR